MRFLWTLMAITALAATSVPATGSEAALPVDEQAIIAEIDRLLDETAPSSEKDQRQAQQLIEKAIEAHDEKRLEKALELYRRAVALTPLSGTLYYEMGLTLFEMGDRVQALENIIRALALDPKLEIAHVMKASLLDDLGYPKVALQAYDRLLAIQPESFMGHLNQGITYTRLEAWENAEASLLRARNLQPQHPSPFFHLASMELLRGHNYAAKDYLEAFKKVGAGDPRLPQVEKKLEKLNSYEVQVDPEHPFATIDMAVQLHHALWRASKHRETFPESPAYVLTYEEERSAFDEFLLPMWREEKERDPSASFAYYDLLLEIDEAGYLEPYIYHQNRQQLGAAGADWLAKNPQRVAAFLAWAEQEGLLTEDAAQAVPAEDDENAELNLPALLLSTAESSALTYAITSTPPQAEAAAAFEEERKRFRSQLVLNGQDTVHCRAATKRLYETASVSDLVNVLRCALPGDKAWERASAMAGRFGLDVRDLTPPLQNLHIARDGDEVRVECSDLNWLFYGLAKAIWRYEDGFCARFSACESDQPSLYEEYFALAANLQAYLNAKEQDETEEERVTEPDPLLETLIAVAQSGDMKGYVLFEILHKSYGLSLRSLDRENASMVEQYVSRFVLARTRAEP